MSFGLANLSGWSTGDQLTPAQINQLDQEHAQAVDGSNGGTYTLALKLTFNGAAVRIATLESPSVNGDVVFNDDVSISGNLAASGNSSITGPAVFTNTVSFNGSNTFNGSSGFASDVTFASTVTVIGLSSFGQNSSFNKSVSITENLSVTGTSTFSGIATFNQNVTFNDPIVINDGVTVNNAITFNGISSFTGSVLLGSTVNTLGVVTINAPMVLSGNGRIPKRQIFGPISNATIIGRLYDQVYTVNGLSGHVDYSIDSTGAVEGDKIRFTSRDTTFNVNVKTGATTLAVLRDISGSDYWVDLQFISGAFVRVASGPRE